jgi:serine/threonine protein kinase
MTRIRQDSVGDLIGERFELLELLGKGGRGAVWRARDLLLDREVALKEMRSRATQDPRRAAILREGVLQEARELAEIRHSNVAAIHEVLDRQPFPWLVMELVIGRPLRDVLHDGALSPARTAQVALDVLGALQAAHRAGVLHRDVEPGNVLIRPDGAAMLTGFGIAPSGGTPTLSGPGGVTGSPEYMAPERIRGSEVGPAADLWSLGMVLYVCVEGCNPMRRDSIWQTMLAVCEQRYPSTSRAGALAPVIDALLARQPELRPTAATLAVQLRAAAEQEALTKVIARPAVSPLVEKPALVEPMAAGVSPDSSSGPCGTAPRRWHRRLLLTTTAITVCSLTAAVTLMLATPDPGEGDAADPPPDPAVVQTGPVTPW